MKANKVGKMVQAGVALAGTLLAPVCFATVTPLLEFRFNDSGTTTTNTGSVGVNATMHNTAGVPADLHSVSGTGVSGEAFDRAFDNTISTGMGGTGGGVDGPNYGSPSLQSMTIMGWMDNVASVFGSGARIYFDDVFGPPNRIDLMWDGTGRLRLNGNGGDVGSTSGAYSGATNQWTFFAVTFDKSLAANNVAFYVGTTNSAATLVNYATMPQVDFFNSSLSSAYGIGSLNSNYGTTGQAFDGMLDNFRLFGSTTDASGALSLGDIQHFWAFDIPEPTTAALLGLAGLLVWRRRNG